MMFKGSPNVPNGELSRRVAREGGNDNAFTSRDYTAYFQQVPKESLDEVLERADEALYRAKRGGRNRVELA